jgi:DNA-binding beta-propeller fold protein YncE
MMGFERNPLQERNMGHRSSSSKRIFVSIVVIFLTLGAAGVVAVRQSRQTPGLQPDGSYLVTTNQALTPVGVIRRIDRARPKDMALSPDGKTVAVLCTKCVAFFTVSGEPIHRVSVKPGPLGIAWGPDGKTVYVSGDNGKVIRLSQSAEQWKLDAEIAIEPPTASNVRLSGRMRNPQVTGLAVSPNGRTLYAALGIRNAVSIIDLEQASPTRIVPVGVCPYHILLSPDGTTLYVSNRGGSQNSKRGPTAISAASEVEVDPGTDAADAGCLSIIDTRSFSVSEVVLGRQPSGMALNADGDRLFVASSDDDSLYTVDTRSRAAIGRTSISLGKTGFGMLPTSCAVSGDGSTVFAACGGGNAVAQINVAGNRTDAFIPAGWFPISVIQKDGMLIVASTKGIGARPDKPANGYGVHNSVGIVQFIELSALPDLVKLTQQVEQNNRTAMAEQAGSSVPVPVPARPGDPSVFKHVVYVIKENHTYDLDFGDIPQGNGDKTLSVFGEEVTPNAHALARQFVLLDNTYTSGTNSADGHQWVASALANGYIEQNYDAHVRSYPYDGGDALAYSPKGFLWNAAKRRRLNVRIFGEFVNKPKIVDTQGTGQPTWTALWEDYKSGKGRFNITAETDNAALRPLLHPKYIGFPTSVSDQWRADQFLAELRQWESSGVMPALCMLLLPNNHTVGSREGYPTPRAMVADNDLALGRIVEALSHSSFWKEMLILVIEDDSQMAVDHVDGHRTVAHCISPYTKRGVVVSEMYNHNSFMRTIGLTLGISPLTRFDRTATPLNACFAEKPNLAPFTHLANRIPLNEMNQPVRALHGAAKKLAQASNRLDIRREDRANPEVISRAAWLSVKPRVPFPASSYHPDEDSDDEE